MKKGTTTLLLVLLAIVCLLAVACKNDPPHEHTYATEWTSDNNHHWHASTCGHEEEVKDKAEHTWGAVTTTLEPTTTTVGKGTKECTICKHKVEVTIDKLPVYKFADGYDLDTTYNKQAFALDKSKIINTETSEPIKEEEIESILYKSETEGDDKYSVDAPIDAGTYDVKVKIKGHEITGKFTIKPKELDGTYITYPITYNGIQQELTLDAVGEIHGVLKGDRVDIKGVKSQVNAGDTEERHTKAVEKGTSDNPNYVVGEKFEVIIPINPIVIETKLSVSKEYDAYSSLIYFSDWSKVNEVLSKDKNNLELVVQMDGSDVTTEVNSWAFEDKKGNPVNNYILKDENPITAEIKKAKLSLNVPEYQYAYDGESTIYINSDDGLVVPTDEDILIYVYMKNANAGAQVDYIDIMQVVQGGDDEPTANYDIDPNLKVSIVPKKLEGSLTKAFEYNARKDRDIPGSELSMFTGLVGEDKISDYHLIVVFENKDVEAPISYVRLAKNGDKDPVDNYYIDKADVKLSIEARELTAKEIPSWTYNGQDYIDLDHTKINNLIGNDEEKKLYLKVKMSNKNAGAQYKSHELVYTYGGEVTNYKVKSDDANVKAATITQRVVSFPSFTVPASNANIKYRNFHLGYRHGTLAGEVITVHYEYEGSAWSNGDKFQANLGKATIQGVDDSKNYTLKIPNGSRINILPITTQVISLSKTKPNSFILPKEITPTSANALYRCVGVVEASSPHVVQVRKVANDDILNYDKVIITHGRDFEDIPYATWNAEQTGLEFVGNGSGTDMSVWLTGLEPGVTYNVAYWKK